MSRLCARTPGTRGGPGPPTSVGPDPFTHRPARKWLRVARSARVIPCRARAGSPDGRAPGRCRRMCGARCVGSLVALPRRQKGLGGPGVDKSGDRTPIESSAGFEGRASRREGHGQPPKLARVPQPHIFGLRPLISPQHTVRARRRVVLFMFVRRGRLVHSKDRRLRRKDRLSGVPSPF